MRPYRNVKGSLLVEHRHTNRLALRVSIQGLRRLVRAAEQTSKQPVMVVELSGQMMYLPEKWAMIPYEMFKELTRTTA